MTSDAQQLDTAYIRRMFSRQWRERSWRGVWFYGTWLFNRYYGVTITLNVAVMIAAVIIALNIRGA